MCILLLSLSVALFFLATPSSHSLQSISLLSLSLINILPFSPSIFSLQLWRKFLLTFSPLLYTPFPFRFFVIFSYFFCLCFSALYLLSFSICSLLFTSSLSFNAFIHYLLILFIFDTLTVYLFLLSVFLDNLLLSLCHSLAHTHSSTHAHTVCISLLPTFCFILIIHSSHVFVLVSPLPVVSLLFLPFFYTFNISYIPLLLHYT